MSSINRVILKGNLTIDPDFRTTKTGNPVANVSLATSVSWIDKGTNERQERTEYHRVVVFGRSAEYVRDRAQKGTAVFLEGELKTNKWQDAQGQDRFTTEIVVQYPFGIIDLLDRLKDSPQSAANNQHEPSQQRQAPQKPLQNQPPQEPSQSSSSNVPPIDFIDDIPF